MQKTEYGDKGEDHLLLKFQDGGIVCGMTSLCKTSKIDVFFTPRTLRS